MRKRDVVLAAVMWVMLSARAPYIAAQVGGYDLSWSTVDGGGGSSSGGAYSLSGAIGQPDAGALSGGSYNLVGGFWGGASPPGAPGAHRIYLPVVLRNQ